MSSKTKCPKCKKEMIPIKLMIYYPQTEECELEGYRCTSCKHEWKI